MRCISPITGYSIQMFEPNVRRGTDASGTVVEYMDHKPRVANFHQGGLLDHEIAAAYEKFSFAGLPEGVNPLTRISSFDTEAYVMSNFEEHEQDEWLQRIDSRLRKLQELHPNDFIIVDQPKAEKPFGDDSRYDDLDVEEVLTLQKATGYSPEKIRLYELENQERIEVIEAMERLQAGVLEESQEEAVVAV